MTRPVAIGLVLIMSAGPTGADSLLVDDAAPWETCGECHGLTGISPVPRFPHLAGQDRAYIEKQLRDFRAGRRGNDGGQMSGSTAGLTEETIGLVAAHFGAQVPPPATPGPANGDARPLIERGDPARGLPACNACHSATGTPRLGGQHAGYLAKQLDDFRTGRRSNDGDGVMRAVAAALTDAEIQALARTLAASPGKPDP